MVIITERLEVQYKNLIEFFSYQLFRFKGRVTFETLPLRAHRVLLVGPRGRVIRHFQLESLKKQIMMWTGYFCFIKGHNEY